MMEAILSIKIPGSWVNKALEANPSIQITVLDVINKDEGGVSDLVEIGFPDETDIIKLQKFIAGLEGVHSVNFENVDRDKVIAAVEATGCIGCRAIRDSNCFLVSAYSDDNGRVRWKLIFTEKAGLQKLVWTLNEHGSDVKLVKLSTVDEGKMLTAKQEMIIKTALDRGYYDFPRRIGIRELSDMFNVSTASLSETLRRGQRKIIEGYFEK